ncbi:MAG: metallophosphoesterase family protein [Candidatus Helarchaeota archaeon]
MSKTLKIGVLSDTHIPTRARALPAKIFEIFVDVDYILHAGDYVTLSVIKDLERIAPVIGCRGNMDHHAVKQRLPQVASLEVEGKIIKIIHDLRGGLKIKNIQDSAPVDIIIHGHTHRQSVERQESVLIINPGSATNSFGCPNSVGVLYLTHTTINFELIELK